MTPHLLGLTGRAGAGKDTLADALAEYGYHRVAFADGVRTAALETNPLIDTGDRIDNLPLTARLADLVRAYGWETLKRDCTDVRAYLQNLGHGMRQVTPSVWVDTAMNDVAQHNAGGRHVVITDVRYPDEVERIKSEGGLVARVTRPGLTGLPGAAGKHQSEQVEHLEVDFEISNSGDCERLHRIAGELARSMTKRSS